MPTHPINPQLELAQSIANELCFKPTLKKHLKDERSSSVG